MSVGEVAGHLGVAPSTVRMWGQRYGLTASARTQGGHRRYTRDDVDRLRRMHEAVISGVSPSVAAADVLAIGDTRQPPPRRGGPGGAVLAVPGAGPEVRGLARAATRLDEFGVIDGVRAALRERGTQAAWNEIVRPVLVAAGEHWQRTGAGIEIEHLLTQAVTTAFSQYVASLPKVPQDSPVVLAGSPNEEHVLALHAVRAALVERAVPARFLGPRTPMTALAATARLTRAPAVLIWMSLKDAAAEEGLAEVAAAHRRLVLLVGGPGWEGLETAPAVACGSLQDAVQALTSAYRNRSGSRET